jgi:hypothetical protein
MPKPSVAYRIASEIFVVLALALTIMRVHHHRFQGMYGSRGRSALMPKPCRKPLRPSQVVFITPTEVSIRLLATPRRPSRSRPSRIMQHGWLSIFADAFNTTRFGMSRILTTGIPRPARKSTEGSSKQLSPQFARRIPRPRLSLMSSTRFLPGKARMNRYKPNTSSAVCCTTKQPECALLFSSSWEPPMATSPMISACCTA